MDPQSLRAFMARDWPDAARSKRAYWVDRFHRDGWQSAWTAAQGLLLHTRRVSPGFPTAQDRERDLLAHVALRASLDRAAHAFASR